MQKWLYEKMVEAYAKESKEELTQRVMALDELECKDRCFANECKSGLTIFSINEIFDQIRDLKSMIENPGADVEEIKNTVKVLSDSLETAENSWRFIKNYLSEMADSSRSPRQLDDFRQRVVAFKNQSKEDESYE